MVAARREAQAADIVVVNHHLLLADLALKDEGFGELLPGTEAVILDEAHQVPEIAAQFFGREFSARQAALFARDALAELTRLGLAGSAPRERLAALEVGARRGGGRALREPASAPTGRRCRMRFVTALDRVREALAQLAGRSSPPLDADDPRRCAARCGGPRRLSESLEAIVDAGGDDGMRWVGSWPAADSRSRSRPSRWRRASGN